MLSLPAARLAGDERGFTLIELLVAVSMGVIVMFALFAILDVALHQTSLITDKVQADEAARTSMTKIVDELHSACLSPGFAPIQEGSNENELIFVNAYSKEAVIANAAATASEGAYKHKITFVEGPKGQGKGELVDFSYPSTASIATWPYYTFSETASPASGTRIGEKISRTEVESKPVPVFQYYKYRGEVKAEESHPVVTLERQSESELKASTKESAAVLISFNTRPTNGNAKTDRSADLSSQVTFAFSAPNAETSIADSPCK